MTRRSRQRRKVVEKLRRTTRLQHLSQRTESQQSQSCAVSNRLPNPSPMAL